MKFNIIPLSVFALVFAFNSYAKEKRISIENIFFSRNGSKASNYIALKYQNMGSLITHNEESTNPNFSALNEQSKVMMHMKGVQVGKEFLEEEYLSVTMLAQFSHLSGNDDSNKLYNEKGSGIQYGGGMSVNLNADGYRLKIQPFYSAQYIMIKSDYELNYGESTNQSVTKLFYENQSHMIQHSVGVRFINPKSNLLSFFSVEYLQELSNNTQVEGSKNSNEIKFDQVGIVENRAVSFSLGFGFMF